MHAYAQAMADGKYAAASSFLALACKINGHGTERVEPDQRRQSYRQADQDHDRRTGKDD